jgi:hypothetical protein
MLRFRLRTLLIAVAILALPMAWVSYSVNWIRQRHAALDKWQLDNISDYKGITWPGSKPAQAPAFLWLFGEEGYDFIPWAPTARVDRATLATLFPEARIEDATDWAR